MCPREQHTKGKGRDLRTAFIQDELSTMNNTSSSYQSLLSEKMHLTRDLSNLKAELDRIKTQSHLQQSSIVARSEMERQLNSLEVQLEDEKHAHERTKSKSLQQSTEINKLAVKAEELQSELVRQSRMKQQHEREFQQQSTEWENQRAGLEGKIETLKKQLRLTKDKLQEAQQDAQQRRSNVRSEGSNGPEPQPKVIPLQRPGPSAEYQNAMTIATPGAVRVQAKTKKQSALPGDKSAFSITPFLNRTGAQLDSPASSEISKLDDEELGRAMSDNLSPSKSRVHQDSGATHSASDQLTAKRGLAKTTKGKPKAQEGKLTFSEIRNEIKKPTNRSDAKVPLNDAEDLADHQLDPMQVKPRKRKLGAQRDRNIFEDEEEELAETRKQGRKLGNGAGQMLGASASDRAPKALGFGGFSPLKRDRKRF